MCRIESHTTLSLRRPTRLYDTRLVHLMISLTQFCFTNVKCTRTTVSFRKNVLQRGVATKDESATSTRHGDPTREKTTERTSSKLEEASPESFSHPRSIPKRSDVVKNDRVLG